MTGPGSKEDLAFTTSGIAYKTGNPSRKQAQVVRVKPGNSMSSKTTIETFEHLDLSTSTFGFSDEELNYDKSQADLITDLVLVVGECFEVKAEDLLGDFPTQRVMEYAHFNIKTHACIETRDTAIVVQRLQDRNAQFYVLQSKQDGLYEMAKLPQMEESHKHIVFYSEFVDGSRLPDKDEEKTKIQQSILVARSQFVETLPQEAKDFLQPDEDILHPTTFTTTALRSWVIEALSSYMETGSKVTLDRVLEVLHKVLKVSMSISDDLDDTTENQLQHIRRLGEGGMTLASAQKFIVAYNELFPDTASTDDIVPEAIIELDAGIHEGGLSSVPTSPAIPDALYRNFVSIFCGLLSWSKSMGMPAPRVKAVAQAYQMAIRGTGSLAPKFATAVPVDAGPFRTIIESANMMILSLIRSADIAIRATAARAAKLGHNEFSMMSDSSLRLTLAGEWDVARANALLNTIVQRESVENNKIMQLIRDTLWLTHGFHFKVLKALDECHGKDASHPTQQVSGEEEMKDVSGGGR